MKTVFVLILLALSITYAQEIPPDADPLIVKLYSTDDIEKMVVLDQLCEGYRSDLIQDILNAMSYENDGGTRLSYLETLSCLGYPDLHSDIISFITEFNNLYPPDYSSEEEKNDARIEAGCILLFYNDTTDVSLILNSVYSSTSNTSYIVIKALEQMFEKTPSRTDEVKSLLMSVVENTVMDGDRAYALSVLYDKFGASVTDFLIATLANNSMYAVKMLSARYLIELDYLNSNSLFKQRLTLDQDDKFRYYLGELLLKKYGEPADFVFVKAHLQTEPDQTTREILQMFLSETKPLNPPILFSQKIDKLIQYVNEVYNYSWLTEEYYSIYSSILEPLPALVINEEYSKICAVIQEFLEQVETDKGGNLHKDGYKYLHYYSIYIKEDLQQNFNVCD